MHHERFNKLGQNVACAMSILMQITIKYTRSLDITLVVVDGMLLVTLYICLCLPCLYSSQGVCDGMHVYNANTQAVLPNLKYYTQFYTSNRACVFKLNCSW